MESGQATAVRDSVLDAGVLTTPDGHALPRILDPVVTMDLVQRYVEQERHRSRRVLLWLSGFFLCAMILMLVLFAGVGLHVLRNSQKTAELAGRVETQTRRDMQEVSSKVSLLDVGQKDVAEAVRKTENQRARESDVFKQDLERFGQWMSQNQAKERQRILTAMEARIKELQDAYALKEKEVRILQKERALAAVPPPPIIANSAAVEPPARAETAAQKPARVASERDAPAASEPPVARHDDREPVDETALLESSERMLSEMKTLSTLTPEQFEKEGEVKGGPKGTVSLVTFPNGDRYEGEFKDGLFNGWGIYTYANGDRYEGEFRNDMKEGRGALHSRNGDRYAGVFKGDMKCGKGRLLFRSGDRFVGDFDSDMINGKGSMVYSNGNRYAGGFRNGLKHGNGIFSFTNGDVYKGDFRNDVRQGRGAYLFVNGAKYIGDFEDGKRHGHGRYIYPDGSEYVGEFRGGKKEGKGVSSYPNGKRVAGMWQNDFMVSISEESGRD